MTGLRPGMSFMNRETAREDERFFRTILEIFKHLDIRMPIQSPLKTPNSSMHQEPDPEPDSDDNFNIPGSETLTRFKILSYLRSKFSGFSFPHFTRTASITSLLGFHPIPPRLFCRYPLCPNQFVGY